MANGLFAGGNGTAESPYLIEDAHDLNEIRNNLTAHCKLIKNIDLNVSPYNEGEGWVPIGDYGANNSLAFNGTFDGNGFKIKNLFINRPTKNYQGLFGHTEQAIIKNIGVEDVNITGNNSTGGLVGLNNTSSIIENSYSTGSVTGTDSNTGGLVGQNNSSSIINSYSTGSVKGGNYTGGLVGLNNTSSIINSYSTGSVKGGNSTGGLVGLNNTSSIIEKSYSTGSVTGTGSSIGGLVGQNNRSSIINSYSTGSVTCTGSSTGGLVGYNSNSSIIENSYSTGSVTGTDSNTGGLVGYNFGSSVINSYSTGSVTGSGNNTGGLVGRDNNSSVINSYWDKEESGWTTSAGGTGKTTLEMQTPSIFVGWENETLEDGTLIWILEDGEYPKLWFEKPPIQNKILIRKSDASYVYFSQEDNQWKPLGTAPTDDDYLNLGVDTLTKAHIQQLGAQGIKGKITVRRL